MRIVLAREAGTLHSRTIEKRMAANITKVRRGLLILISIRPKIFNMGTESHSVEHTGYSAENRTGFKIP
jgi:hypothetical protein